MAPGGPDHCWGRVEDCVHSHFGRRSHGVAKSRCPEDASSPADGDLAPGGFGADWTMFPGCAGGEGSPPTCRGARCVETQNFFQKCTDHVHDNLKWILPQICNLIYMDSYVVSVWLDTRAASLPHCLSDFIVITL